MLYLNLRRNFLTVEGLFIWAGGGGGLAWFFSRERRHTTVVRVRKPIKIVHLQIQMLGAARVPYRALFRAAYALCRACALS